MVTTEKDLVKLEKFPFATDKLVALRIDMEVDDVEQFLAFIESQLKGREKKRRVRVLWQLRSLFKPFPTC